jgi:hemerythrin
MIVKLININTKYERDAHKQALKKFVELSRQHYDTELKIIEEFEENYHQHSPIWWYTRNSFY